MHIQIGSNVAAAVEERKQFLLNEEAQKREQELKLQKLLTTEKSDGVQRLAIDLSFDAIMNEKELRSLAKQMKLSYGVVKQMATPFQLHFFNCSAPLQQSLQRFSAEKWRVHWHPATSVTQVAAPSVRMCVCAIHAILFLFGGSLNGEVSKRDANSRVGVRLGNRVFIARLPQCADNIGCHQDVRDRGYRRQIQKEGTYASLCRVSALTCQYSW